MKILLDTHILLWALCDDPKLGQKARRLIQDESNEIFASVISVWETEIKHSLHPTEMALSAKALVMYCGRAGFKELPVKNRHIYELSKLERHGTSKPHKDPFDRLLICQALSENMVFLTRDRLLLDYGLPLVMVV